MNKKILYLLFFVLAGCGVIENNSPNVFFAGEIVNPVNKDVFLYKDNVKIDSTQLDEQNRFFFQLDSIEQGLYHFETSRELQYVFFEPGDSLQLRLNTIDFDESLVFSGTGAKLNNFLLDLFLANEKEEREIRSTYFNYNPADFHEQIENLRKEKLNALDQLNRELTLSKEAQNLAEVSINYSYYNYKEIYPFEHRRRTGKRISNQLNDEFYAYRNTISLNEKKLNYFTPYYNFVKSHLRNISISGCEKKCGVVNENITNQLHYNRHKLGLIDSLIQEVELKDNLFRNVAFEYLLRGQDTEKNNEIFIKDFYQRSGNNRHLGEIKELYQGIRNMQPNKKIPPVIVTDFNGNLVSLQEIAKDKKVAFYFWSGSQLRYFKDVTKRIEELSKAEKKYTFIGINYQTDESTWKGMVSKANLNSANQYKSNNFEELAKALTIYQRNKCIITKDAKIIDGFTTLWDASF